MKLTILSTTSKPSNIFPLNVDLSDGSTLLSLKLKIHKSVPNFSPSRQRLSNVNKEPLKDDSASLSHLNIHNGDILYIKDLGPQVSWTTVFLVEYAGPLLIHPFFYHLSTLIYRKHFTHSNMQALAYTLILIHFFKREFETIFIHRFSNSTMPFLNIFRNSAHYHLLSGLLIAIAIYGPWYSLEALKHSHRSNPSYLAAWSAFWLFCQISNLITHLKLRNLRPPGTKERNIPTGYGFDLVSCANYFFEIGSWVAILGITGSWAVAIFLLVSAFTMAKWAKKKDALYRKQFGDKYPKNRRILIPYIW
ncbi:hypothetical protein E3P92_03385 [Wallemia ichthyophaga]|uniref:Ubiquitin-like domain-containing protein n=2 Tax=Wallemia ichthyophaga TaxID=245174 RepID=A0A4T0HR60_WALIC|nr:Putative enoyl reductase [Wallemia ichthyophaga EXF-994]TIA69783.1 hypothetical protein E3P91_03441 [Wallemia ichthyophaga]EOQ99013.1 Putative enoyl reductase [Wallemia ichthyophaga EXF-994]TIA83936.1 hypothetical protein E3P98_00433 [Wallemia ichthyophaga]TIA90348.1 hypothetical protein E3P97_02541 [Wallemia ichthyophaga]TIA95860.1 hypothetical protein E3P95_03524 [Wallemia ichthyophaga]